MGKGAGCFGTRILSDLVCNEVIPGLQIIPELVAELLDATFLDYVRNIPLCPRRRAGAGHVQRGLYLFSRGTWCTNVAAFVGREDQRRIDDVVAILEHTIEPGTRISKCQRDQARGSHQQLLHLHLLTALPPSYFSHRPNISLVPKIRTFPHDCVFAGEGMKLRRAPLRLSL